MIEQKVIKTGNKLERATLFLKSSLKESSSIERRLEKKSLALKKKIVEDRGRTLKRLASGGRDKGTGGVLGSALSILGIGAGTGGIGVLARGLRRTPNTPSQLLKMQKGTSVSRLSRIGRVGRLAKPIAVVGAGLDFVGRKAEGQTNTQAGVGAAGGLAGGLAGAKIGASFGSLAGPVGTVIGGAGGAIIGSLAGGRIADLFTGANRRRQFEEERVQIRTSKTLFSDSLDDFDRVLNKLEKLSPNLSLKSLIKDERPAKFLPSDPIVVPPPTPPPKPDKVDVKPEKPFFKKPAFISALVASAIIGTILLTAEPADIIPGSVFIAKQRNAIINFAKRLLPKVKPKTKTSRVEILGEGDTPIFGKLNKDLQKIIKNTQKGRPGFNEKGELKNFLSKSEIQKLLNRNEALIAEQKLRKFKKFLDAYNLAEKNLLELTDSEDMTELFEKFNELTEDGKRALEEVLATQAQEKEIKDSVRLLRRFIKGDTLQEILGEDLTMEDLNSALRGAFDAIDKGIQAGQFDDRELVFIQKLRNKLTDALSNLQEEMVKRQFKTKLKDNPNLKDEGFDSIFDEDMFDPETMKRLLKIFPDISSNLEPSSSSDLASLSSETMLLLGNRGNNTPTRPQINDSGTSIVLGGAPNILDVIMSERQIRQSFTT